MGFLAFDLLFIPPYLTLSVADPDHVLALFVYLGVAVVTARLVSGMRERTEEAIRESRRSALLAELNAALIGGVTLEAILDRVAERVVTVYGAKGCRVLVVGEDGELHAGAFFPASIGPEVDRTGLRSPSGPSRTANRSAAAAVAAGSSSAPCRAIARDVRGRTSSTSRS